jgi:tripartite-type tricarboxylate transporter receptor subunit TctC
MGIHLTRIIASAAILAATAGPALAAFPDKPVRIIVSSAPGGYLDIISRAVAQELTKQWGQTVFVENKPGGSGSIGAVAVQNSVPDGYTWLAATEAHIVTNQFTKKDLPYKFPRDFVGISVLAKADQMLVANKTFPANTLPELVDMARKSEKKLAYGSWGIGSHPHLFFSKLGSLTNTKFVMIPYKGVAPVLQALRAHEVNLSVMSVGTARPLLQAGELKVLAAASRERSAAFPDVPTTTELGYPSLRSTIFMMLLLPRATPPDIVAKASSAVQAIVKQPEFAATVVTSKGFQVVASDSAGVAREIEELTPLVADSIKAANISPE